MPMRVEVRVEGNLPNMMGEVGGNIFRAAQEATAEQTEETKRHARAVVAQGLGGRTVRGGMRQVANTIRSRFYADAPAGFVHSTWGYFEGGQFVDILQAHVSGATIEPRNSKALFIPFVARGRRRGMRMQRLDREKLDLIPLGDGRTLVVTRARGTRKGLVLGMLAKRVRLPARLDFTRVEQAAETGLLRKFVINIDRFDRARS